ncbi:conserved hypothetical protein [Theileria equi strain WA]|uniref:Trimethylguanosine synthase n=1 Tax=Theileria equi strain WA TaxID=1537102 RepID=L1LEI8_THEEQ|nr:conserved hypothetical protein [Theileria equi strain WA]EKX73699.1 conserved hypothetical protein [Theileria equi strain WA]|eukprot:XP_004833151.1 conserved hypothetical protein [Theileria equi strain WA]
MFTGDDTLAESLANDSIGLEEGNENKNSDDCGHSNGLEEAIDVCEGPSSHKEVLSNTLYWEYNNESLFDVRLDELLPNVLYLASCISTGSENGQEYYKAHSAFVSLGFENLEYDGSAFLRASPGSTPPNSSETYISYITSNIFSRFSVDIQMDEAALYDVSWEPEALDLCRQLKEFLDSFNTKVTEYDSHVFAVNEHVPTRTNYVPEFETEKGHLRILDATCGIGGNLVHFAGWFDFAVGVEINPSRARMCMNNLSVYGVDKKSLVVNDDFLEWAQRVVTDPLKEFKDLGIEHLYYPDKPLFDWTFISPPWGGRDYKGTRDSDVYYLQQGSEMDVFKALELASQLSTNVTLYLPRSQSIAELVKLASYNGFTFIFMTGYLTSRKSTHVRCGLVHFVKNIECFSTGTKLSGITSGGPKLKTGVSIQQIILGDKLDYRIKNCTIAKYGIFQLIPVRDRAWKIQSSCRLNLISCALMQILKETRTHFSTKLAILMKMCPLPEILRLVDAALEVQFSGGMFKDPSIDGQQNRTTGGVFFNLLKTGDRDLYRRVEREYNMYVKCL